MRFVSELTCGFSPKITHLLYRTGFFFILIGLEIILFAISLEISDFMFPAWTVLLCCSVLSHRICAFFLLLFFFFFSVRFSRNLTLVWRAYVFAYRWVMAPWRQSVPCRAGPSSLNWGEVRSDVLTFCSGSRCSALHGPSRLKCQHLAAIRWNGVTGDGTPADPDVSIPMKDPLLKKNFS